MIRHNVRGRPSVRGITPRRLSAARRALEREQERYALLAEELAAEQPTPEVRITAADLSMLEHDQGHRELAARQWRWARRQLAKHPDVAAELVATWNAKRWLSATAAYFADFVFCQLRARGLATAREFREEL